MKRILIVEDDVAFAKLLEAFLKKKGFSPFFVTDVKKAKDKIEREVFDLFLLDYRLPDGTGLDIIQQLKDLNKPYKVIMMTSFHDVRTVVRAMKMGASDFITKPVNPDELLMLIHHFLEEEGEKKSATTKKFNEKEFIVGPSSQAEKLQEYIQLVAPTDMSIIIEGESGTGKEYVARQIHSKSRRSNKHFVAIDCGVLSKELAAGELFGYVKGAFTGALMDKRGQFEMASGGTLFLDEIGNLSYDIQVKLLRVLQEKVVQPVGSEKLIPVNVRVICATNDNLMNSVSEGDFREDLYHRINEFKLIVPALRERDGDLMIFVYHFIHEANAELERNVKQLSSEVIKMFREYDWPGNLRELRNCVRRMVLLSTGDEAGKELLPEEMMHYLRSGKSISSSNTDLKVIQADIEKDRIEEVLKSVKYNKSKAARLLNIDRKTLYHKLAKYGLDDA